MSRCDTCGTTEDLYLIRLGGDLMRETDERPVSVCSEHIERYI